MNPTLSHNFIIIMFTHQFLISSINLVKTLNTNPANWITITVGQIIVLIFLLIATLAQVVHDILNTVVFFFLIEKESVAINFLDVVKFFFAAAVAVFVSVGGSVCSLLIVFWIKKQLLWISLCFAIVIQKNFIYDSPK